MIFFLKKKVKKLKLHNHNITVIRSEFKPRTF